MSPTTGADVPSVAQPPPATGEPERRAAEQRRRASTRGARVAYAIAVVWVVVGFALYGVQLLRILH